MAFGHFVVDPVHTEIAYEETNAGAGCCASQLSAEANGVAGRKDHTPRQIRDAAFGGAEFIDHLQDVGKGSGIDVEEGEAQAAPEADDLLCVT